ncbi:hypothetical protein [Streptomyces sp. MMG1121]|uniref:hypothetical protein n=1 Tax=Streptomyces sp. MMG1121 TaxID=1415544 RepID=UPI0006AE9AFF|nr:hypothetical protein [Streptomyces sp. MMG1121]KOV60479.1 hypothetical protein ADK64_30290 [Streptomyces sp. MMG1121]
MRTYGEARHEERQTRANATPHARSCPDHRGLPDLQRAAGNAAVTRMIGRVSTSRDGLGGRPDVQRFPKQSEVRQEEFHRLATGAPNNLSPSQAHDLHVTAVGTLRSDFEKPTDHEATMRRAAEHVRAAEAMRVRGASQRVASAFAISVAVRNLGGLNALMGHNGADSLLDTFTHCVSAAMDKVGGSVSKFRFGPRLEFIVVGDDVRRSHIEAQLMAAQAEIQRQATASGLDAVGHPKYQSDLSEKGSGIRYGIRPIRAADSPAGQERGTAGTPGHGRGTAFKSSAQERKEKFLGAAVDSYGLSSSGAAELFASSGADEVDELTGFDKAADRRLTLANAVRYVAEAAATGVYVEVDLRNLGGLTKELGRKRADEVYAAMSAMTEKAVMGLDADVSRFRHGGDEFSFIVVGHDATPSAVDSALVSAQQAIKQYVEAQGLSEIRHPKHPDDLGRQGTGIIFGVASITPATENVDSVVNTILSAADRQVEAKK